MGACTAGAGKRNCAANSFPTASRAAASRCCRCSVLVGLAMKCRFVTSHAQEPFLDEKCLTYLCVTCFKLFQCLFVSFQTCHDAISAATDLGLATDLSPGLARARLSSDQQLAVAIVLVASKPTLASSSLCSALFVLFVPQLLSFNSNQRSVINRLSSYLKREREREAATIQQSTHHCLFSYGG